MRSSRLRPIEPRGESGACGSTRRQPSRTRTMRTACARPSRAHRTCRTTSWRASNRARASPATPVRRGWASPNRGAPASRGRLARTAARRRPLNQCCRVRERKGTQRRPAWRLARAASRALRAQTWSASCSWVACPPSPKCVQANEDPRKFQDDEPDLERVESHPSEDSCPDGVDYVVEDAVGLDTLELVADVSDKDARRTNKRQCLIEEVTLHEAASLIVS